MNLIVTGATSFLGSALIRRLYETGIGDGCGIYAVIRPHSSGRERLERELGPKGIRIIELDMEHFDRLPELIPASCRIFFHFAWDGAGSENRKNRRMQEKNVTDSLKALRAAMELGCFRFLFSGSQAEYGLCGGSMTEETVCDPISEYGKAKLRFYRQAAGQTGIWNRQKRDPMEYIHMRIFSVYGPGDHPGSLVNTCLKRFQADGTMELGACTQLWNYLYIDDLTDAVLALAFCEKAVGYTGVPDGVGFMENGIYNLAAESADTRLLKDYVEKMRLLCGGGGDCAYGKLPPHAEGEVHLIPEIGKIAALTGWKPKVGFEEGIRRMMDMERAEGR